MPSELLEQTTAFVELFAPFVKNPLFQRMRQEYWQKFLAFGLPQRGNEAFQYIRLQSLYQTPFQKEETPKKTYDISSYRLPECAKGTITFVNGSFRSDLSDISSFAGATLLPLDEAMKSFGTYLQNALTKTLKDEKDPFTLLNGACFQDGAFLYIPAKIQASIQIIYLFDAVPENSWMMPRLHIFVGPSSELTVASTYHSSSCGRYFLNGHTEITLEENSRVSFALSDLEETHADAWQFESFRFFLKRSSRCMTNSLVGSTMSRRDWKISLGGSDAEALLYGIWLLDGKQEAHTHVIMEHLEPHCQSNQFFKGVLNGASRSSFQGKILVEQKAQKTEAYQLNNNLILSESAEANSKPNLEIFADDVKATHGATCGQIDLEELFYLKSRGIPDHDAKNCLINGFCEEIVSTLPFSSLIKKAHASIHNFLEPLSTL